MSLDLDVSSLLIPFEGDSPAGIDLRPDSDPNNDYRRIRDAREDARDFERQAKDKGLAHVPSDAMEVWRDVWSDGLDYLRNRAKDVEIVAYMIEASIRVGGFQGLAQCLDMTREIADKFWDDLYPTRDEDGVETTLLPIARLNGEVISFPIMQVPVTEDTSVGEFVVWQYSQAKQLESMSGEERERRISDGAVTIEQFNLAVAESSDEFFQSLAAELSAAQTAITALNDFLEDRATEEFAPNLSRFSTTLSEAESTVRQIAGDRLITMSDAADAAEDAGGQSSGQAANRDESGGIRGQINTRDEALELLEKVAKWFQLHEPQSILPSEIRKAKRRAKMTPEELYRDLIADSDVRERLFKDVGIEIPDEE